MTHAHTAKRARSRGGAEGRSQQILVQFRSRKGQSKSEGAEKPEVFTKFVLRKENMVSAFTMLSCYSPPSTPTYHPLHSTPCCTSHTIHSSHFTPCHSSQETLEAVSVLSQAMDCHTSQLAYAGSKDARAITTQCMTVR